MALPLTSVKKYLEVFVLFKTLHSPLISIFNVIPPPKKKKKSQKTVTYYRNIIVSPLQEVNYHCHITHYYVYILH